MSSSDNQNKLKRGQFGNARDGAVAPGARHKAAAHPKADGDIGLRQVIETEAVSEVIYKLEYDREKRELVYTSAPSGGTGTGLILSTVVGGNSPSKADALGALVAGTISLPLPITDSSGKLVADLVPHVDDWSKYELPDNYAYGGSLRNLPDGLCWIKLERPYSLGGESWDSGLPPSVVIVTSGPLQIEAAACDILANPRSVTLYFNRNISATITSGFIALAATNAVTPLVSSVVRATDNTVTVTLDRDIVSSGVYTVSVQAGKFQTSTGSPAVRNNGATEIPLKIIGDAIAYLPALNRRSFQSFLPGDLVHVLTTMVSVVDDLGVSVMVADILSNASNMRSPHTHTNNRSDGSGGGTTL